MAVPHTEIPPPPSCPDLKQGERWTHKGCMLWRIAPGAQDPLLTEESSHVHCAWKERQKLLMFLMMGPICTITEPPTLNMLQELVDILCMQNRKGSLHRLGCASINWTLCVHSENFRIWPKKLMHMHFSHFKKGRVRLYSARYQCTNDANEVFTLFDAVAHPAMEEGQFKKTSGKEFSIHINVLGLCRMAIFRRWSKTGLFRSLEI